MLQYYFLASFIVDRDVEYEALHPGIIIQMLGSYSKVTFHQN